MFHLNRKFLISLPLCGHVLKCLVVKRIIKKIPLRTVACSVPHRTDHKNVNTLFPPISIKPVVDQTGAGCELAGKLDKLSVVRIINKFYRTTELKILAHENDLDEYLLHKGFTSFRKYCLETENLPAELHILFSDISKKAANHLDIFPYFLNHIKEIFPHLNCMDDLKKIGDLRTPAKWYSDTRSMRRKIIFHCGPTNSGKTYHAIQRFLNSKSGVYCGPLKLLAVEIYNKANESGVPCDLITGEEIIHVNPDGNVSAHVSCTVEMCSMEKDYDVAVIDEIQMIKDLQRGWSWTRALLGVKAKEIHLCGEEAAVDIIDSILCTTNEELEVQKYSRLTKLTITAPIQNFDNVQEGDCIVCFNKNDIYKVTRALEKLGKEVAVIYGALPPGTKLAQCKKFNDPDDPCKILVATDAVGMGLNLNIRRVIFYSLMKVTTNDKGEKELKVISVSQALQIAGRAGRYGSKYSEGFTTTFKGKDYAVLESLLSQTPEVVLNAGLHPTIDQIELYSFYLPNLSLSNILEIFVKLCTVDDSMYFVCDVKDLLYFAELLDHVNLPLRVKYIFCCAPISRTHQFTCTMFLKFAKLYSENRMVTVNWLCRAIDWPVKTPTNIRQFVMLEATHDVLDLYLWLGYRFPEYFPDAESVRNIQQQLDKIIQAEIINMTKLLENTDKESEFFRPGEGTGFENGVVDLLEELESSPPTKSHKDKLR